MNNGTNSNFPPSVSAVLNILIENEIPYELGIFEEPAHQASQAARLVGCPLGAIVKSLVFEKTSSGELLLVLVSGQNRADVKILSALAKTSVQTAKPEMVLSNTGYPVGAVPPCGLDGIVQTIIDVDLIHFQHVWASAGAINTLIRIQPSDLCRLTDGRIEDIKLR